MTWLLLIGDLVHDLVRDEKGKKTGQIGKTKSAIIKIEIVHQIVTREEESEVTGTKQYCWIKII